MLEALRKEIYAQKGGVYARNALLNPGYRDHVGEPNVIARAYAIQSMFEKCRVVVFDNDLIPGTIAGAWFPEGEAPEWPGMDYAAVYGDRDFFTNNDHFAPNYSTFFRYGVGGTIRRIEENLRALDPTLPDVQSRREFLEAARIAMQGFSKLIKRYADAARAKVAAASPEDRVRFCDIAEVCSWIMTEPPRSFREALTLTWLVYAAFVTEGRYAMAFGRMDQYLYPYYEADVKAGVLDRETAVELVACTLLKIGEWRVYWHGDDVSNIAIGGVTRDGKDAVNELTYVILEAVGRCNIPGPNLSARISKLNPPEFLPACLKVIGTGLGYPALMNDEINVAAMERQGYPIEECRDYCMVGCIENFLPGKQPPWSDGRFDNPRYIEAILNHGISPLTGKRFSYDSGPLDQLKTMDDFMRAYEAQLREAAREYVARVNCQNTRLNPKMYQNPFLSCFCDGCIERGRDINNGGALFPSAHGAGCMGIGTVVDSLAAIEKVVYIDKEATLEEVAEACRVNFEGKELLRAKLLAAPKYGNDDELADKYARWFVEYISGLFDQYRTYDGGRFYIGIASNISNISAGKECGATPDGRCACEPLSDAASPTYGRDRKGPLATVMSVSKPDYTLVGLGTVLNQKYSPSMFATQERIDRLAAIIRTYFERGGQEMQINSVSRDILSDAIEHPENYKSLVVRVSGFSAYYVALEKDVQHDILSRTEQE